ncbi:discoidin domain-containing protein [Acidobacteriota bacterium]
MCLKKSKLKTIFSFLSTFLFAFVAASSFADPMTEHDLTTLIKLGINEKEITDKIRSNGISFIVDDAAIKGLKEAGASNVIIAALMGREKKPSGSVGKTNVIFILDGSGSMWGNVDGNTKIGAAKEVMAELTGKLPDGMEVGLMVYGHREKGDCSDIELLVEPGPVNRNSLRQAVQSINPKGMTPITASLERGIELLKGKEGASTLILVSDGKETCEGNPCDLVRKAREAGVNTKVHVVGFDVTDEEKTQLECIAKAGEGEYFTARTASDLRLAIDQVAKSAISQEINLEDLEPENIAAVNKGGRIVFSTSEKTDHPASNLLDEGDAYWEAESPSPWHQMVILGFKDNRKAKISDILINPASNPTQEWVKDVDVQITTSPSPFMGYEQGGKIQLKPVNSDQVISFDPPVTARYIKFNFLSYYNRAYGNAMGIGEIKVFGNLLLEESIDPREFTNIALAENGGHVVKFGKECEDEKYSVQNLIDGKVSWEHFWGSCSKQPQEVIIKLPGDDSHRVRAVLVNPYTSYDSRMWTTNIEIQTSNVYVWKGFETRGAVNLIGAGDFRGVEFEEPIDAKFVKILFMSAHSPSAFGHFSYQAGEIMVIGE